MLCKNIFVFKTFFIFLGARLSWPTFMKNSVTNMYNKVISGYNYGKKPFSVKQYCNIVHNKDTCKQVNFLCFL